MVPAKVSLKARPSLEAVSWVTTTLNPPAPSFRFCGVASETPFRSSPPLLMVKLPKPMPTLPSAGGRLIDPEAALKPSLPNET